MMTKQAKVADFIQKLYEIVENESYNSAIGWSDDELVVKDTQVLVRDILPRYYRHSKLESFVRQLNLYGFKKVPKPYIKDSLFFKNEFFKPGRTELLTHIQLKSKDKRQESKNFQRVAKKDDIRMITQRREEELLRMRAAFRNTMQLIYAEILHIKACDPNLEMFLRDSMMVLQLSGAEEDAENIPIRQAPSITDFFTKVNIDLD